MNERVYLGLCLKIAVFLHVLKVLGLADGHLHLTVDQIGVQIMQQVYLSLSCDWLPFLDVSLLACTVNLSDELPSTILRPYKCILRS